jgi:hypothetical protein
MVAQVRSQKERIDKLEKDVEQLIQENEFLRSLLSGLFGFDGQWLSPDKAGQCINLSRERIMQEVRAAETARSKGQKTLFEYGVHYRNDQDVGSTQAAWKINVRELAKYFNTPPDQRRIYK